MINFQTTVRLRPSDGTADVTIGVTKPKVPVGKKYALKKYDQSADTSLNGIYFEFSAAANLPIALL